MKNKLKLTVTSLMAAAVIVTSGGAVIASAASPNTPTLQSQTAPVSGQSQTLPISEEQTISLNDRTPKELKEIINNQPSSTTKSSIQNLLSVYEDKAEAADAAEEALVAGLLKYGVKNYTTNGTLDTTKIEAAIKNLKDKTAVTALTKLLTSYKNAVTAEETAKAALTGAMEKADYNKKTDIIDISGLRNNIESVGGTHKTELLGLTDEMDKLIQEGVNALNAASNETERQNIIEIYDSKFETARNEIQEACDQYGINIDIPTEWYA